MLTNIQNPIGQRCAPPLATVVSGPTGGRGGVVEAGGPVVAGAAVVAGTAAGAAAFRHSQHAHSSRREVTAAHPACHLP